MDRTEKFLENITKSLLPRLFVSATVYTFYFILLFLLFLI